VRINPAAYCPPIFNRKAIITRIYRKRFKSPGKTITCSCRRKECDKSTLIGNTHQSTVLRLICVLAAFSPGAGPVSCTAPVPGELDTYNIGHIGLTYARNITIFGGGTRVALSPFPRIRYRLAGKFFDGSWGEIRVQGQVGMTYVYVHSLNRIYGSSLRPMRHMRIPLPSTKHGCQAASGTDTVRNPAGKS
jgi:hypothetical protein